jgi:Yip1 domain
MSLRHVINLFVNPRAGWTAIHARRYSVAGVLFGHTLIFALIPALAGYFGTTRVGWQVAGGELVRLTAASAGNIALLYYLAMLAGVGTVGWAIHWMGRTYGASQPIGQCIALASFTATPLFLVGVLQAYPVLWLNLVVGLPALAFTTYLFFTGVPIMMEIPEERGFLFSSAMLAFGLVTLVAMLAVTALLWGTGFAPAFTS